jgi:hypothetical protein
MSVGIISMIVAAAWVGLVLLVIAMCRATAHADAVSDRLLTRAR